MNCPMCNVLHIGPILTLHIECDLDHVADHEADTLSLEGLSIDDPIRIAESLCNLSLDQADQQAAKHKELEAKAAALKVELDEKSKQFWRKQAIASALARKSSRVENRVKELSTLSERHRENINGLQNALNLKQQVITELEKQIHKQETGV
ncbi:hypothetical protein GGI17_002147 [Coemansia sp. S146]|nr:hypothetical protein GGI17_002147 [Coemansia sp. S146]